MAGTIQPGLFVQLDPNTRYELLADDQAPRRKDRQYDLLSGQPRRSRSRKRSGIARLLKRSRRPA